MCILYITGGSVRGTCYARGCVRVGESMEESCLQLFEATSRG